MYSEKDQLAILDKIANIKNRRDIKEIDLVDPIQQYNYNWLTSDNKYLQLHLERVGSGHESDPYRNQIYGVEITYAGEQRRFVLREKFQNQQQVHRINLYTKWTFYVALLGLVVALLGLFGSTFQDNRNGYSTLVKFPPSQKFASQPQEFEPQPESEKPQLMIETNPQILRVPAPTPTAPCDSNPISQIDPP